jgi:uncharacterized protein YdaU (DUF1376 family)
MAEFPGLTIWTDAWIADTVHLTRLERGLYMDMLILCWRTPGCRMPNEVDWIAARLRCSQDEIPILKWLIAEFMTSDGNWVWQKRLRKEFEYVRKQSANQSARAKSRWEKDKKNPRAYANTHTPAYAPTPTPTPSKKGTVLENRDNLSTSLAREAESASQSSSPTTPKAKLNGKGNGHTSRGSRLPDEWEPEIVDNAVGYDLGMSEDKARLEFAKFGDYWRSQPGAKGLKLDWNATFRNWLRKAATQ